MLVAIAVAAGAALDPAQRQAVSEARAGFERWVQAMRREVATFQSGDRQAAIAASVGPDRALRKGYSSR